MARPSSSKSPAAYWLLKSEPGSYSIDDFRRDGKTLWTGIRNYQARNFMMTAMKPGDEFLFYHSNADPAAVVGVGRILRVNLPDPTALDSKSKHHDPKASEDHPIWFCAEVGYVDQFKTPVSLPEIRNKIDLSEMLLLKKGQRLSIQPVTAGEFVTIREMGG